MQAFRTTEVIHILKHLKFKNLHLIHNILFPSLNSYNKNGFSLTWHQEDINCCKPSIFQICGGAKGLPCSLRWSQNEAASYPRIILEPTILSRFVESSWGRIRVWPSNGRSHNTMQGGWVPNRHLSLEWPVNHANGYTDRLDEANLYRRGIFFYC